jgi:hypothetical protein
MTAPGDDIVDPAYGADIIGRLRPLFSDDVAKAAEISSAACLKVTNDLAGYRGLRSITLTNIVHNPDQQSWDLSLTVETDRSALTIGVTA